MTRRLFAVERYDGAGGESPPVPVSLLTTAETRLVCAVRLPADDVVLALVEGPDQETVAAVAVAVGWRVDRLSPAAWVAPYDADRVAASEAGDG
ncbi:hypothetical protein GCM10027280_41080 [Micromonospora polyrhachis]|uniref:Uncharacterized protein n=1 Tax=Micromonospora polyrhachis TaxID=1282883 RepID=A0A7W7WMP1_9ACTN|nr:hypothetical protein [Micromonospora polyrhachis]MBB4956807.1 hypothetical protein [Micromonospora polyrhachis]